MSHRFPMAEEKKAKLRATSNHHWWRCQQIGKWLNVEPTEAHQHWSCCISKTGMCDEPESPGRNEIAESACTGNDTAIMLVKEAYLSCLTRKVQHERELLEYKSKKIVDARDIPRPLTTESAIRIMCWAIRTIGDESSSAEAFKQALERRKGIQKHYY